MIVKAGKLVAPCSSKVTETGAWRTFKPVIDQGKCIKCSLCEIYCPEGCIHQVRRADRETLIKYGHPEEAARSAPEDDILFVPDLTYCKGCSVCAHECPHKAIEMLLEEK
jgi:pyruvate ferredoxin oxidoreductase delta subunit